VVSLDPVRARELFAAARVLRMGTTTPTGQPHLVPATFVVDGDRVAVAVDAKPKRSRDLVRLRNVRQNPAVGLLVDHYDEDWTRLWWVRADGVGTVVDAGSVPDLVDLLVGRYPQLRDARPDGEVLVVEVTRWVGWAHGLST
jgi:PPOX class probable F420-dependent enzyme